MRNLFDPRPKSSRNELYDRRQELEFLDKMMNKPLTLVLGIRRIGKTSLIKAFLEPYEGFYVDLRGVNTQLSLYERLAQGLSEGLGKLKDYLMSIRGVSIMGFSVSLKWRGQNSINLLGLLEELNRRGRFIIVFDEVQEVKPPLSVELRRIIAYSYDNLDNVTLIMSGSQVGLLENFIGQSDAGSPLFGRYMARIEVPRFTRDQSYEFLKLGFKEEGVEPPGSLIDEAVSLFDGIPGWLVHFGRSYIDGVHDLEAIKEQAISLALSELNKLPRRGKLVLRAIANGAKSWSSVRRFIEEETGETIPKSSLTRMVNRLEELSVIKDYQFLDPIHREAAKMLR